MGLIHRAFAIILLFTPSLGLFDTLHHARCAALPIREGRREFDISDDGSKITIQQAWEPYQIDHISLFLEIPLIGVVTILTTVLLFHIFGSTCILNLMGNKNPIPESILQAIHTLISPPLHIDWETFYRKSDGKLPIKQCWKRLIRMAIISTYNF